MRAKTAQREAAPKTAVNLDLQRPDAAAQLGPVGRAGRGARLLIGRGGDEIDAPPGAPVGGGARAGGKPKQPEGGYRALALEVGDAEHAHGEIGADGGCGGATPTFASLESRRSPKWDPPQIRLSCQVILSTYPKLRKHHPHHIMTRPALVRSDAISRWRGLLVEFPFFGFSVKSCGRVMELCAGLDRLVDFSPPTNVLTIQSAYHFGSHTHGRRAYREERAGYA